MRPAYVVLIVALLTALRVIALAGDAIPLYGDEAQYWLWSRDMAFGYWSKPPMIAWLIRAGTELFGDREFGVRVFAPLLHAAAAGWIYGIGAGLFDRRVGAWSALLYILLPGVSVSSMIMSTDAPLLCGWAAAMGCFVQFRKAPTGRWGWALGFGLALGVAALSKYAALLLIPALILYAVVAERDLWRDKRLWAGLALALLVLAPNIAWNAANDMATLRHTRDNANLGGGPRLRPGELLEFLGAQFGVFGPVLFALLLARLTMLRRLAQDKGLWLLTACVLPSLVMMCSVALISRAHANWAASAYIGATVLIGHWLARGLERAPQDLWRRLTLAAVAVTVLIHSATVAVLLAPKASLKLVGLEMTKRTDPYRRMRGARALARQVEKQLKALPPDTVVMTEERLVFATLSFYLRPRPEQAAFDWNDTPQNHFELIADYKRFPERPMLLVTRDDHSEALKRYRDVAPLGAAPIASAPDDVKTYHFFRVQHLAWTPVNTPAPPRP